MVWSAAVTTQSCDHRGTKVKRAIFRASKRERKREWISTTLERFFVQFAVISSFVLAPPPLMSHQDHAYFSAKVLLTNGHYYALSAPRVSEIEKPMTATRSTQKITHAEISAVLAKNLSDSDWFCGCRHSRENDHSQISWPLLLEGCDLSKSLLLGLLSLPFAEPPIMPYFPYGPTVLFIFLWDIFIVVVWQVTGKTKMPNFVWARYRRSPRTVWVVDMNYQPYDMLAFCYMLMDQCRPNINFLVLIEENDCNWLYIIIHVICSQPLSSYKKFSLETDSSLTIVSSPASSVGRAWDS